MNNNSVILGKTMCNYSVVYDKQELTPIIRFAYPPIRKWSARTRPLLTDSKKCLVILLFGRSGNPINMMRGTL